MCNRLGQGINPRAPMPYTLVLPDPNRSPVKSLTEKVGKHVKRVDAALPGKDTRQLYDRSLWKEASVLVQPWEGVAKLNGFIYGINIAPADHVNTQERPWNASSYDVRNGRLPGRKCCNIPILM
jgi:hypothetical protein